MRKKLSKGIDLNKATAIEILVSYVYEHCSMDSKEEAKEFILEALLSVSVVNSIIESVTMIKALRR